MIRRHQTPPRPRIEPIGPARRESSPYRRVGRQAHREYRDDLSVRPVRVGALRIGDGSPVIIAGPCAVESREQTLTIARAAAAAGAHMLRGGAFKPRTSPYEFQGLGREGLEILAEARAATGLPVVTEVLDPRHVELVAGYADCLQVGARSMQNFPLLREVGQSTKPVLLKRHWAATLCEWLGAAEYVAAEGNLDIILCERGIRTFSHGEYNRHTLDLNVVPAARLETMLPIVVDPSHSAGRAELVAAAGLAGLAAGADGLLIEVIADDTRRDQVLCDGSQAIRATVLGHLIADIDAWARRRRDLPRAAP
jgi:3-deoxy-7-phosphoheptulonate synthase